MEITNDPPAAIRRGRPAAAEPTESWMLRTGLSISVWLLALVATVLAASGQIQFAHWAGITDVRAYAVPAVLELVAVAFLLIGYRRARRGDSPAALWLLAAAIGGFAVYTNVAHSGRAGLVFGAASAITMILWFVKLRDDYRHFQRHTGQATRPRPKLGALWIVAPRLSARAWVVAARRRISTVDEAVACAEVWRAVYEDSRRANIRRSLARRTAWRSVAEVSGGVRADLPRTAEVAAVDVVRRATLPQPPAAPAGLGSTITREPNAPMTVEDGRRDELVSASPGPRSPNHHLAEQVRLFLATHLDANDHADLDEADDPYLSWAAARALNVNMDEIADDIRSWRREVSARARRAHAVDRHRVAPFELALPSPVALHKPPGGGTP